MTDTMLAGRLDLTTREFALREVAVPVPEHGEVRIRVGAAGVCLSDVHLIDGMLTPAHPQGPVLTLGHEVAGTVDTLGAGVTEWEPGDRVLVEAGYERDGALLTMGVDYDGGWAEFLVVPQESLIGIPDAVPFEQAAIIPDAVSTPWGAIEWTAQLRAGQSAAVWGVGGLGAHAIQLLRFAGAAPLIAVDPLPAARERALSLGADLALDPADPEFRARVAAITGGAGLDVAFDFAGVDAVRAQAISALGLGGKLVLVGLSGTPVTIADSSKFTYLRRQVLGHYGSERRHLEQLVELTRLGRLDFAGSVSEVLPLSAAPAAVARLRDKVGDPIRIVLVP